MGRTGEVEVPNHDPQPLDGTAQREVWQIRGLGAHFTEIWDDGSWNEDCQAADCLISPPLLQPTVSSLTGAMGPVQQEASPLWQVWGPHLDRSPHTGGPTGSGAATRLCAGEQDPESPP